MDYEKRLGAENAMKGELENERSAEGSISGPPSERFSRVKLLGSFAAELVGTFGLAAFDSRYDTFVASWKHMKPSSER